MLPDILIWKQFASFVMLKTIKLFLFFLGIGLLQSCFIHSDVVQTHPVTAKSSLCGTEDCHGVEYSEWKGSAHSRAFVNESFRKVTSKYKVKECLTCHATNPIYDAKELTTRNHNREEGVSCVVCHLTPEQEIAGPLFVLPAHSVKMNDPYYKSSKLCGTCHEEHFQEWEGFTKAQKAKGKDQPEKTCQDCHMPEIQRKIITKGVFQYVHWEQPGKKHTFGIEVEPVKGKPWFQAKANDFKADERGIQG